MATTRRSILLVVVMVAMAICFSGCEKRRVSEEFNKLSRAFEAKMDKGETTREQEQAYIKAVSRLGYEVDRSIRGKKKSDQARAEVDAIINGTGRPGDPFRIEINEDYLNKRKSEEESRDAGD
jgi:hypothetical protein